MTFKKLIKKIVKKNNLSLDQVRYEIAQNMDRSLATVKNWEIGTARPNIIEGDKLQRFIKEFYKIDINIYKVFLSTYRYK